MRWIYSLPEASLFWGVCGELLESPLAMTGDDMVHNIDFLVEYRVR
jgi:hypothetical protein